MGRWWSSPCQVPPRYEAGKRVVGICQWDRERLDVRVQAAPSSSERWVIRESPWWELPLTAVKILLQNLRRYFSTDILYFPAIPNLDCWRSRWVCTWLSVAHCELFRLHRDKDKRGDRSFQHVTYLPDKLWQHPRSTLLRLNELIWWPRWGVSLSLSVKQRQLEMCRFFRKKRLSRNWLLNKCAGFEINSTTLTFAQIRRNLYAWREESLMCPQGIQGANMLTDKKVVNT